MIERANNMTKERRNDEYAEKFDRDLTIELLSAEARGKNYKQSPWSRTLHDAMVTKEIIKRKLTSILTNRDMSVVIQTLQDRLPQPIPIPDSLSEIKAALRTAQKECRQVVLHPRNLAKQHQETRIIAKQLANPDKDLIRLQKVFETAMRQKKCGGASRAANQNHREVSA